MLALENIYKVLVKDLSEYREIRGFYVAEPGDSKSNSGGSTHVPILYHYQTSKKDDEENKSVVESALLMINNVGKNDVLSTQKANITYNLELDLIKCFTTRASNKSKVFKGLQTPQMVAEALIKLIEEAEPRIQNAFIEHATKWDGREGKLDKILKKHKTDLEEFVLKKNFQSSKCPIM